MEILWDCPHELCTREVLEQTSRGLAYTTVATVLTNLARKGMVEKVLSGRTWAYRALRTRGEYVAALMTQALLAGGDHAAALRHFVESLSAPDAATLRALLGDASGLRRGHARDRGQEERRVLQGGDGVPFVREHA